MDFGGDFSDIFYRIWLGWVHDTVWHGVCYSNGVVIKLSRHQEWCAKVHPPTEWNTTVVAERRCARKGNMFQEAARLDCKTGGFAFDGELTKQKEQGDTMYKKVICEKRRTYALSTAWGRFRAASEGVRGHLVYRGCISKKRYNDEYSAHKEAKRITFMRDTPLRVYHCRFCNGYHLTSKCVTPDCPSLNDVA